MVINFHQMETSSNTLKKAIKMIAEGQSSSCVSSQQSTLTLRPSYRMDLLQVSQRLQHNAFECDLLVPPPRYQ